MRRFLSLLLLALPINAQQLTYDTALRVEMKDGRVERVPLPLGPDAKVIVEFRDAPMAKLSMRASSATLASYASAFQRFRADVASVDGAEVRWEYFRTFNGAAVRAPRAGISKIAALPYVKAVYPDREVHALQEFTAPANVKQVKADQFWTAYGTRGAGVVIAIIDTGVDYTHPAIAGHFAGGYDFVNKDNDPMDDHFHGTHVAGIAAGNSGALQGVAPEATLMAFKVLNSSGSGFDSDILAAIERTVDPNGDGNTSDHVDVANLSLGGGGGPDDPLSIAVDNASALGVVFAIAAGNSGGGHTIGSPGTARSAVTVGAVDDADTVATFSSRGPNMKDLAVKPEVCAPGVNIVSSLPGGGYGSLSGTSMATPHVAGVAALLRAAHHDWSPARIKAALIASASNINNEVMATGSGRIDAVAASGVSIGAEPPALTFGLDSPSLATFTATRTVRLTNRNSSRASLTFTVASKPGEKVTINPSSLSLEAGEAKDLSVTVEVTNATITTGSATLSGGGQIVVKNGSGGTTRIPYGYTKAARATVTFDSGFQQTLWFGPKVFNVAAGLDDRNTEALLAPGTYDYLVYNVTVDPKSGAASDQRIVYREAQAIDGDVKIDIKSDAAPHIVTFAGRDEHGARLSSSSAYASWGRLFLHPDWRVVSLHLPAMPLASMHASDLSLPKLAVTEALYDLAGGRVAIVNQPLVTSLGGDVTLSAGGADLNTADLRLFNPAGLVPFFSVTTSPQIKVVGDDPGSTVHATLRNPGTIETNLRLAMNAPAVDGYGAAVVVSGGADNVTWYTAPAIVHSGGTIAVDPAPKIAGGFDYAFGFGPLLVSGTFSTITAAQGLFLPSVTGQAGEERPVDGAFIVSELHAPDGTLVTRGFGTVPRLLPFGKPGMFRLDSVTRGLLFGGVPRTTTLSLGFDPSKADATPPAITTVALLDGAGNLTRLIEPNGAGALRFSVTGGDAKKVSYKVHGKADWIPISATQQTAEVYLVELGALAKAGRALYDVKIETADGAGNTATLTYEPAFSVGTEVPPRGRAAAH
ncbi:MAG TPA: S8 family serine peptidase [Thermoanaerobaculia bacterium]|nr:S8 family serine peptidase [Thermoanaerobaculia bacterium]